MARLMNGWRASAQTLLMPGGHFRRGVLVAAVAAVASLLGTGPVAWADPGQVTVQRFMTDGDAETLFGGCDFIIPPGPLTCHETYVAVFKEGVSGVPTGTAPPKTPWRVFIDDYTVSFASGGPDAVPVFLDDRTGFLTNPAVTFDQQHLSFLTADAQVPMSDGSTFDFHGDWSAISDRLQYGNNGQALGLVRHYVDRCNTANNQAHQKYRIANMTGTLNGVPVQSYPGLGLDFIAHNHFILINVTHGDCLPALAVLGAVAAIKLEESAGSKASARKCDA